MKSLIQAAAGLFDAIRFNPLSIAALSSEMTSGKPPARWQDTSTVRALDGHFTHRIVQPAFWRGTSAAYVFCATLGAISALVVSWYWDALGSMAIWALVASILVMVVSAGAAITREFPTQVTPGDFRTSTRRLHESGDQSLHSMGAIAATILMLVIVIDAVIAGGALARYFGAAYSQRMQDYAALAFGIGLAGILYKLLDAAASEGAVSQRAKRHNLLANSRDAAEREQAAAMKLHCAGSLGANDAQRLPIVRRATLALAIIFLAGSMFVVRSATSTERIDTTMSGSALLSDSGDLPTLAGSNAPRSTDSTSVGVSDFASNAVLSIFFALSMFAAYFFLIRTKVLGAHSPMDRLITERWHSVDDLHFDHIAHAERVQARANRVYARLGRCISVRVGRCDPSRTQWPAWDVTYPAVPRSNPMIDLPPQQLHGPAVTHGGWSD